LVGRTLLLPNKLVKKLQVEDEWALDGFEVRDVNLGLLGLVQEIVEYPYQSLAKVFYGERELLIPLVDEIIVEINDKKKLLLVNMPEGLIDINN
jgi:16S rRNA processing protein RimM